MHSSIKMWWYFFILVYVTPLTIQLLNVSLWNLSVISNPECLSDFRGEICGVKRLLKKKKEVLSQEFEQMSVWVDSLQLSWHYKEVVLNLYMQIYSHFVLKVYILSANVWSRFCGLNGGKRECLCTVSASVHMLTVCTTGCSGFERRYVWSTSHDAPASLYL